MGVESESGVVQPYGLRRYAFWARTPST